MTRPMLRLVCTVTLLASCIEEDGEGLDKLLELGDPCRTDYGFCIDETTAQRCVDQIWTSVGCADVCAELGPAYVADACVDDCVCVLADPSGCVPRETTCISESDLGVCNDVQVLETVECNDVCVDAGLESIGCVAPVDIGESASCWCTGEGTPCDPESPPVCADSRRLARCESATWTVEDCAETCGGPAQCIAWAVPSFCECSPGGNG